METEPLDMEAELHTALTRIAEVEEALREAQEAAHDFYDASAPTGYSNIDRKAYSAAWVRLRAALKGNHAD